jgi:G3E family GTPase
VVEDGPGGLGPEAHRVTARRAGVAEIDNGCMHVEAEGDVTGALRALLAHGSRLERIVVETPGFLHPGPWLRPLLPKGGGCTGVRLAGVVALAHARELHRHFDEVLACRHQLALADLLLVNHCDRVTDLDLDLLEVHFRRLNPCAEVWRASEARVPLDRLLRLDHPEPRARHLPSLVAHDLVSEEEDWETTTVRGELDEDAATRWLERLRPCGRERFDAVLAIRGIDRRCLVRVAGGQVTVEPGWPWGAARRRSRLVAVGPAPVRRALAAGFARLPASEGEARRATASPA